LTNAT